MDWSMLNRILHEEYEMNYRKLEDRLGVSHGFISGVAGGTNKSSILEEKILDALQLTPEQYEAKSNDYKKKYGSENRSLPQPHKKTKKEKKRYPDGVVLPKETKEKLEKAEEEHNKAVIISNRFEDKPDKYVDRMSDAELNATKNRECKGNSCERCQLMCAIGKEIKKRGMLRMDVQSEERKAENDQSKNELEEACAANEIDGARDDKSGAREPEETKETERTVSETGTGHGSGAENAGSMDAEKYPLMMAVCYMKNANPTYKEVIETLFGEARTELTADEIIDVTIFIQSFNEMKADIENAMKRRAGA